MAMEESKELQGSYKIFRASIYVSLLLEFFMYAIDPEVLDHFGGVVVEIHDRMNKVAYLSGRQSCLLKTGDAASYLHNLYRNPQ